MKKAAVFFTDKGKEILSKLNEKLREPIEAKDPETPLGEWTEMNFGEGNALIFIGAAGIAVRSIAPFVKDKLSDSPVIIIDDSGSFVIPLLSGHVGGANKFGRMSWGSSRNHNFNRRKRLFFRGFFCSGEQAWYL